MLTLPFYSYRWNENTSPQHTPIFCKVPVRPVLPNFQSTRGYTAKSNSPVCALSFYVCSLLSKSDRNSTSPPRRHTGLTPPSPPHAAAATAATRSHVLAGQTVPPPSFPTACGHLRLPQASSKKLAGLNGQTGANQGSCHLKLGKAETSRPCCAGKGAEGCGGPVGGNALGSLPRPLLSPPRLPHPNQFSFCNPSAAILFLNN